MTNKISNGVKKCIVLDLDNTLWGGIIGEEDDIKGIKLGLTPPGSSFVAFQQALLDLYNNGILLTINSKNNFNDAMAVIRNHPDMILKEKHFAAMRINWNDKAENLHELAKELNVGLDSMIFIDDDPTNRLMVKMQLPQVETPDFPEDPTQYVKFLNSLPYFSAAATTNEDKMRGNFYVTERLRKEHEKKFESKENFLKNLEIEVDCYQKNPSCVARLSQLTGKTNQFNANKRLLSEKEIDQYIADPDYAIFHAKASDRFGQHGVIAFALVKKRKEEWNIETLLMSCRVLGKGIEEAFLESIKKTAAKEGTKQIHIEFIKTEKNQPAEDFIKKYFDNYVILTSKDLMPSWIKLNFYGRT